MPRLVFLFFFLRRRPRSDAFARRTEGVLVWLPLRLFPVVPLVFALLFQKGFKDSFYIT